MQEGEPTETAWWLSIIIDSNQWCLHLNSNLAITLWHHTSSFPPSPSATTCFVRSSGAIPNTASISTTRSSSQLTTTSAITMAITVATSCLTGTPAHWVASKQWVVLLYFASSIFKLITLFSDHPLPCQPHLQTRSQPGAARQPYNEPASCHNLGHMDIACRHCGALHWLDEKLVKSLKWSPRFTTCCNSGEIRLPKLLWPPQAFLTFADKHRWSELWI